MRFLFVAGSASAMLASCAVPTQSNAAPRSFEPAPAVFFAQNWCPEAKDINRLREHVTLVRNGCCIYSATPIDPVGVPAGVLTPYAAHIVGAEQTGRCTGANAESREAASREAALLAEATAIAEEAQRRDAPGQIRNASDGDLCVDAGVLARGNNSELVPVLGADAATAVTAEIKRRRLTLDGKRAGKSQIRIGDSYCHVIAALGWPRSENRTVTAVNVRLQMVYGSGVYVYLTNGRVDAWQD